MTDDYWNPLDYVVWFGHYYKTLRREGRKAFRLAKEKPVGKWSDVIL